MDRRTHTCIYTQARALTHLCAQCDWIQFGPAVAEGGVGIAWYSTGGRDRPGCKELVVFEEGDVLCRFLLLSARPQC